MSVKIDFIKGTVILVLAGMTARFLGLLNRIYLANLLSSVELGRYQLLFPVLMFCMAVTSSGIQVAVSKMVASFHGKKQIDEVEYVVETAIRWTLLLSLACSAVLCFRSEAVCSLILKEKECQQYIEILAVVIPFASVHSCISGYFYGCRKTMVPAGAQMLEQSVRLGSIYVIVQYILKENMMNASAAVYAMAAGEAASCLMSYVCYRISVNRMKKTVVKAEEHGEHKKIAKELWRYSSVLTINRVSVSMLQSAEMILIPLMLVRYIGDSHEAIGVFGMITGIVMPILMFPNTISNALAVLLLPSVSEAEGKHNYSMIAKIFEKSMQYCMTMSIFAGIFFAVYGRNIGNVFFNNVQAGEYIRMFSVLCPLMYIQSLMTSILNGFGRVNETLMHHITASAIRIVSILIMVPKMGITGYIAGICAANLVVSVWALWRMKQLAAVSLHIVRNIVIPLAGAAVSINASEVLWRLYGNAGIIQFSETGIFIVKSMVIGILFLLCMLPVVGGDIKREKMK